MCGRRKTRLLAWLPLILAIAGSLLWPASGATQADGSISYDDYKTLITQARERIKSVSSQTPEACELLDRIAADLEAVTSVHMPDGSVMPLGRCCGIDEALRAEPCDLERADAFLKGLCPDCDHRANQRGGCGPGGGCGPSGSGGGLGDGGGGEPGNDGGEPGGGDAGEPGNGGGGEPGGSDGGGDEPGGSGGEPGGGDAGEPGNGGGGEPGSGDGGGDEPGGSAGSEPGGDGDEPGGSDRDEPGGGKPDADKDQSPGEGEEVVEAWEWLKEVPIWLWVLLAVALVLLIVGLVMVFNKREADIDKESVPEEDEPEKKIFRLEPIKALDWGRQLALQGRYREAVRYLVLAVLSALDEKGLLRFERTLTNRELLASARTDSALVQLLSPVVATFDRVWYGFEPFTLADYDRLVGQIEILEQF